KMSDEVCPTVPTKITIAKDGQHGIGLRIRKGIGQTDIAWIGGAANARDEPDPIVIVGLPRIEIMGIIDAEAQWPLFPGGQNIELSARIEHVEIVTKAGNTSGSGEGTGTRGRTHRGSASRGTAEQLHKIGDLERAIRVALSGYGVQFRKAVISNSNRQFNVR